jgi:hypothetical protein
MKKQCKYCNQIKDRIFFKKYDEKNYKYADADGKKWNGARCPDCHVIALRKNGRCHDDKPSTRHEITAAKYFESFGMTVRRTTGKGPDLVIGKSVTVEVKGANYHHGKSLRVCSVKPKRLNDDLVAIVMPDNRIIVETMTTHLSKCDKSGSRTVTHL